MTKKYIVGVIVALLMPVSFVFALTPIFTASGSGDNNNVNVSISNADGNTGVFLYYRGITDNTTHSQQIGTTNAFGSFSGTVSTNNLGILSNTQVYTLTNGYQSNSLTWPYNATVAPSQLVFSQNNINLNVGQSSSFTVTGGNGTYYIASNSNNSAIPANLFGNTVSFSGASNGSTVIKVCSGNDSTCNSTTISTSNNAGNGFSLNPSNLTLGIGQSGTIQLSGGNAPYSISTLSGNGVAYSFNGNALTVTGANNGVRTLNVCSSNGVCSSFTVNITPDAQNNILTLSPSSVNLTVGQSGTVQISGGNTPYSVYTITGNTVSSSISGNTLTLTGTTQGATSLNVCSSNGACSTLAVSVGTVQQASTIGFTNPLAISQVERIALSGGNGSAYYIQSAIATPIHATLNGNTLIVTGITYGTAQVTVCQNGNSTCLPIAFNVNESAPVYTGTGGPHIFNFDLWIEMTSEEVRELQNYLIGEQYLGPSYATGYFGPLTFDAVKRFQAANNITATGYVGPLTRSAMNQ